MVEGGVEDGDVGLAGHDFSAVSMPLMLAGLCSGANGTHSRYLLHHFMVDEDAGGEFLGAVHYAMPDGDDLVHARDDAQRGVGEQADHAGDGGAVVKDRLHILVFIAAGALVVDDAVLLAHPFQQPLRHQRARGHLDELIFDGR